MICLCCLNERLRDRSVFRDSDTDWNSAMTLIFGTPRHFGVFLADYFLALMKLLGSLGVFRLSPRKGGMHAPHRCPSPKQRRRLCLRHLPAFDDVSPT